MPLIRVTPEDLAKSFRIWLTIIGQRQPHILRNIWTRKGDEHDSEQIDFARSELARSLMESLDRSKWHVVREENDNDRLWRGIEED